MLAEQHDEGQVGRRYLSAESPAGVGGRQNRPEAVVPTLLAAS